jgi:teichuronic acid biosynthesis glycosyltransferase TuaG
MNTQVSIITPSYNSSQYIRETVQSVISQTYSDWELIIVDDGSIDNSDLIIKELVNSDTRIKAFFLKENKGVAFARNKAISEASGRYIAFLDSDDIWSSDKLEKQLKFMKINAIAFSFTSYQPFSSFKSYKVIHAPQKISYEELLRNTIIGCLTVVIDTELIKKIFMPDYATSQDYAAWLLILKKGYFAYGFNENLAKYRVVSTSNSANKIEMIKGVWSIYRESEKLNILQSFWCLINYMFNAILKRI